MSDSMGSAESDRREVLQIMGQYGVPAYARRAKGVELALTILLERCQKQREEWLDMVRLRLGQLQALAGEWSALEGLLGTGNITELQKMQEELRPQLRVPLEPSSSARVLRAALGELVSSIERFNSRWVSYLAKVDLSVVNDLRDGYNRYYVLEKECALRNSRVAGHGFEPLPPLTVADLERMLPPLFVPRLGR